MNELKEKNDTRRSAVAPGAYGAGDRYTTRVWQGIRGQYGSIC